MTNEQRERITALRHQGQGYATIANAVGLSKDSVKAFCRITALQALRPNPKTKMSPPIIPAPTAVRRLCRHPA